MGSKKYNGRGPGGTGRPPGRIGRGGIGPAAGNVAGNRNRGGTRHRSGGGAKKKGACDMWIPIAVPAVLFYALPRMFFDYLRGRRG